MYGKLSTCYWALIFNGEISKKGVNSAELSKLRIQFANLSDYGIEACEFSRIRDFLIFLFFSLLFPYNIFELTKVPCKI